MNFPECEALVLMNFRAVVRRGLRDPGYPFIDTKIDVATGRDFNDPWRGREAIYGWIQGRGMEALAGHIGYFSGREPELCRAARTLLGRVTETMERFRARNGGRIPFLMNRAGERLTVRNYRDLAPDSRVPEESNYTDIFYFKGLFHAGVALDVGDWRAAGSDGCRRVLNDLRHGRFRSDQEFFDPKNPAVFHPGKYSQGPWMLMLGALAGLMSLESERAADAEACFRHIVTRHIRRADGDGLAPGDFVECVDREGRPWREASGAILCDPGHALEFAGLTAKSLWTLRDLGRPDRDFEVAAREILGPLIVHVFDFGYQPGVGGIVKSYDLAARRVVNGDMPWWSLPETIRAAVLTARLFPDAAETPRLREIADLCWAAFLRNYVHWKCDGMAIQTRGATGAVAAAIPATPDADPGYHTGLSLLDCLIRGGNDEKDSKDRKD